MRAVTKLVCFVILVAACDSSVAQAEPPTSRSHVENVFGFAGRYTRNRTDESALPINIDYEDNYVIGGGYQRFFFEPREHLNLGLEAGLAARLADPFSAEVWGGAVLRIDGPVIGGALQPALSTTFGVSAVTGTFGSEANREREDKGDSKLLFYLSPEISLGPPEGDFEIFYRLHHRSGAWGRLGDMGDGANAQVIGFRRKF